jgi:hypothetical protein
VKKFVIYANCQSSALAKTLMENREFSSTYEWLALPGIQMLKEEDIPEVLTKVQSADCFIHQPISAIPNRPIELTSAFLLQRVKPEAKILSFPSLYFDGYFPHLETLKGYISVLNLVHDYFIAYCCSIGLTIEQTLKLIQKEDLYPEEVSITLAERSLKNLSDRETEFFIDIKVSSFIRDNFKFKKLFNQFNHPKRIVFKYIAEKILQGIGIRDYYIEEPGVGHLDGIMTPIYKSTYKNLNLQFNEDFETYNGLGQMGLKQREVIKGFFDFYRDKDLKEIYLHISRSKPFVPQIVKANL